ncbi:Catalase [Halioglobus japonicus]|nr:Catalase [Halioglobus japonicus]
MYVIELPYFGDPLLALDDAAKHCDCREYDDDYFSLTRPLFQLMTPAPQQMLFDKTARAMRDAPQPEQR